MNFFVYKIKGSLLDIDFAFLIETADDIIITIKTRDNWQWEKTSSNTQNLNFLNKDEFIWRKLHSLCTADDSSESSFSLSPFRIPIQPKRAVGRRDWRFQFPLLHKFTQVIKEKIYRQLPWRNLKLFHFFLAYVLYTFPLFYYVDGNSCI